jgi:uncharacterized membrane protein
MLKYLIQVVQNSLAAAVLVALLAILVYQDRSQQGRRYFARFCITGAVMALILAVLRRSTVLINREYVNILTLTVAFIAGLVCIIFSLCTTGRSGEDGKPGLADPVVNLTPAILAGILLFYALPTIYLYPTEFLMAGQSLWSTDFLFNLTGFLAGLLIVFLSALALFESGQALALSNSRNSRLTVRLVLALGLGINMVTQLTTVVQFLAARRIIRLSRQLFKTLIWLINNNGLFIYALLVLTLILPVLGLYFSLKSKVKPLTKGLSPLAQAANPAERRKDKAARRRIRRWCVVMMLGFAAAVFTLTVLKSLSNRGVVLSPAEPMTIQDGEILIPLEQIRDGHLHRFAYTTPEGVEVRFIVIQKNEVSFGVGLDACDICGATGYYERKGQVICRLCDVVMNVSTIGFKGGCNPVPLASAIRSGYMVIRLEDLENEQNRFE